MTFQIPQFERDVRDHQMQVISDNGVSRHLRFRHPDSMDMHFDLITWPGYLCFTGDMGTYVFERLQDMFEFFRRRENRDPYRMDVSYWAEKVRAADVADGVREWSADKFRREVRDFFEQYVDEDWPQERRDALWAEIEDQVCDAADDGEHAALAALHAFKEDDFRFEDWERNGMVWTRRFLWCCCALEWAVGVYDRSKLVAQVEKSEKDQQVAA